MESQTDIPQKVVFEAGPTEQQSHVVDKVLERLFRDTNSNGPTPSISTAEFAELIQHYVTHTDKEAFEKVKQLRVQIGRDLPILHLWQTYVFQEDGKNLSELTSLSDDDARRFLSTNIEFLPLVKTWISLNKSVSSLNKQMWSILMMHFSSPTFFDFPVDTSETVQKLVIKNRCKQEADFLKENVKRKYLVQLVNDMQPSVPHDFYLNLKKDDLCETVADLNTLTRVETSKAIQQCEKLLNEYNADGLHMDDFKEFQEKIRQFRTVVDKWRAGEMYFLNNKEANLNNLQNLHKLRLQVKELADTCANRIKTARKNFLKDKQLNEPLTFKETLQRYF